MLLSFLFFSLFEVFSSKTSGFFNTPFVLLLELNLLFIFFGGNLGDKYFDPFGLYVFELSFTDIILLF